MAFYPRHLYHPSLAGYSFKEVKDEAQHNALVKADSRWRDTPYGDDEREQELLKTEPPKKPKKGDFPNAAEFNKATAEWKEQIEAIKQAKEDQGEE